MSRTAEKATSAPPMRVGIVCPRLAGHEVEAVEMMRRAQARGFDGVFFTTPRQLSADLNRGALRDAAAVAAELPIYLEFGLGSAGPHREIAPTVTELTRLIRAGRDAGCTRFLTYTKTERRSPSWPHSEQLATIADTVRQLIPVLHDLDCYVDLKTHEDLSSVEVLRLIEQVGDDRVGVGLDVANVVVRGEDPVTVTRRLAPRVRQAFLDDVALYFVEHGLRRKLLPCGTGVLDWARILSELAARSPVQNLTIEQHRGQFDVPIFVQSWFDAEPHVRAVEIAALVRMARQTHLDVQTGRIPKLSEYVDEPHVDDRFDQFARSATHIRGVLTSLGSTDG